MEHKRKFAERFRIENGENFRLNHIDPAETGGLSADEAEKELLETGLRDLREQQDKLYANGQWAVLVILQGMDAAGKDSLIKHVMSGVNPIGCEAVAFGPPSQEELRHDFLWRVVRRLPERRKIGIFNRSYFEEVLVVRVHPELLSREQTPQALRSDHVWRERCEAILAFERHLVRDGTVVLKFFLHLSKDEQKRRFLKRLDNSDKNWKFSVNDIHERKYWQSYMEAYEQMIRHTATPDAPWYVVPADHKWFTQLVVASAISHTLDALNLSLPKITGERKKELEGARTLLENE